MPSIVRAPNDDFKPKNKYCGYKHENNSNIKCFNCNLWGHKSAECKNKKDGLKCLKCSKFGHITKLCDKTEQQAEQGKIRKECCFERSLPNGSRRHVKASETLNDGNHVKYRKYEPLPKDNICLLFQMRNPLSNVLTVRDQDR
ncbi:hypothetical protein NPIL_257781 [Nephila pilipes]|uniref:CCHC-type domain-containing protein n=1 Tax=Nephila pilipes TaxID=299642 RepID=A0A8X6NCS1_NEPPI|nr:hypothetical protein NPIL_257781 [Nephila pilipes]